MSGENSTKVLALVRNELLRLARFEDALAAPVRRARAEQKSRTPASTSRAPVRWSPHLVPDPIGALPGAGCAGLVARETVARPVSSKSQSTPLVTMESP
jgi:hypothetical protein